MTLNFKIFMLIGLFLTACEKTPTTNYLPSNLELDSSTNLYVTTVPKLFDTLTIFVTKDKIEDYRAVSYFKKISKYTGDTNIATNISYGDGNKRYKETMKYVKSCGKINPNNIPLVLFYIKDDDTCYKLNYNNYEEFQSIMDLTAQELDKAFIEPTEIRKFQLKQIIHDEAKRMELSKTLLDSIDTLIDKIFEVFKRRRVY